MTKMDKTGRGLPRGMLVAAVAGALLLGGCSTIRNVFDGRGKDRSAEPAELSAITQTATASRLWTLNVGGAPSSGSRWTLGLGGRKKDGWYGVSPRVAIADGRVYAAGLSGQVVAADLRSGATAWSRPLGLVLSSGAGAGEGVVVVGSIEGDVVALDAATGNEKWRAKVGNEVLAAPAVGGGMVFVRGNDGRITAFDAATGERRWFHSAEIPALTVRGNGGIAVGPGLVFASEDNGTVTALSASDGHLVWSTGVAQQDGRSELDRMADVDGAPILDGTTVYATSYKKRTMAIDGPSGQPMWERENGGPGGIGLAGDRLVVTERDGGVWALDRASGGSLWQQAALARRNVTAPAVQGEYAVVGDFEGYLHWLRLSDGAFAARLDAGDAIIAQPAVADGVLVVQSADGQVSAFSVQ